MSSQVLCHLHCALCPLCVKCPLPFLSFLRISWLLLIHPLLSSTVICPSEYLTQPSSWTSSSAHIASSVDVSILPQRGAWDGRLASRWFVALARCGFQAAKEPGSFPSHARFSCERTQMCVLYVGVWEKSSFQTSDSTSERWR